ncbi:pfs domain-containing protein [Colletotrichum kahawae]|uniref:Pfs domain-containing protein n=1 Tax=Colletotrichum kahawae TaxID=34407 RepID=A0AAE0D5J3_COLKA|nr:pfs domain-containing protein [Colletotrichum kahawae]
MMAFDMNDLSDELKRQLRLASVGEDELQTTQLRQHGIPLEASGPTISDASLLWKVPAFCLPTPYFFDPEQMIHRLNHLKVARVLRDPMKSNTLDFWLDKTLLRWFGQEEQGILLVQGRYNIRHQIEHFSLEITRFLSAQKPTIFVLSSFSSPGSRMIFGDVQPEQVLRQLSIQALERISTLQPLSFLASILEGFQTANSCSAWSKVLRMITGHITDLYVILDLGAVNAHHIELLRSTLRTVFCENRSRGGLKIMLMSSRKLEPVVDPTEMVLSPTGSSCLPFRSSLSSVQKSLQSKLGKSNTAAMHAANATATSAVSETSVAITPGSRADHRDTEGPKALPISTSDKPHKVTIAIFCALPLESDAVEGQLNEYYQTGSLPTQKVTSDINTYSRGRVGVHHVVLVHLAGMGKSNAAVAAANCKTSFPDIKLALIVGICGGIPSYVNEIRRDIVLGDVVVSEGLIPFDYGRQYPDKFAMKDDLVDILGKPPPAIRSLLNKLKGQNGRKYLAQRTCQYLGKVPHDLQCHAIYPGVNEDKLYEETYRHKHRSSSSCRICTDNKDSVCEAARSSSCEALQCSDDKLVPRPHLDQQGSRGPAIHFGLMASGDQVMKSGEHRNGISERHNVIAFEMEGAGVWDIFPCIVIKGVCDYADSHKNKKWQRYAAATAAACMKALLDEWTMTS